MMIDLLGQTTIGDGYRSWSVAEWSMFFTLLTALIGAVTASIISIIKSIKADANSQVAVNTSNRAQASAESAHVVASAANAATNVNTERVSNLSAQTFDIRKQMPAAPTPEAIARAAATQQENP